MTDQSGCGDCKPAALICNQYSLSSRSNWNNFSNIGQCVSWPPIYTVSLTGCYLSDESSYALACELGGLFAWRMVCVQAGGPLQLQILLWSKWSVALGQSKRALMRAVWSPVWKAWGCGLSLPSAVTVSKARWRPGLMVAHGACPQMTPRFPSFSRFPLIKCLKRVCKAFEVCFESPSSSSWLLSAQDRPPSGACCLGQPPSHRDLTQKAWHVWLCSVHWRSNYVFHCNCHNAAWREIWRLCWRL